jgi:hypothetical protein
MYVSGWARIVRPREGSRMQICITQRDGVRYFSRFKNIPEGDKLEVELVIEGDRRKVLKFDLTDVFLERLAEHPEIFRRRRVVDYEAPRPNTPIRATRPKVEPKPVVTEAAAPKRPRARKPEPAATVIQAVPEERVEKKKVRKTAKLQRVVPTVIDPIVEAPKRKPRAIAKPSRAKAAPVVAAVVQLAPEKKKRAAKVVPVPSAPDPTVSSRAKIADAPPVAVPRPTRAVKAKPTPIEVKPAKPKLPLAKPAAAKSVSTQPKKTSPAKAAPSTIKRPAQRHRSGSPLPLGEG